MIQINNKPEVLVIDDNSDFVQSAAALIQTKYGITTIPICIEEKEDKEKVIETIQHNVIKVAAIDQVMPIKGTELFQEIKKVSPDIKAIMLTGEATSEEIGTAMNIGFSSYLNKDDITKLPDEVFNQYALYESDHVNNFINNGVLFTERKLYIFPIISYSLVSISKINGNHIFDDSWNTVMTIHAGEEAEVENTIGFEDKITMTEEYEHKIKGDLDISGSRNMITLKNIINTELNKKYSSQHTISKTVNHKSKKKWSLPKEPDDPSIRHIVKRVLESAPVYNEYKIVISKKCRLCKNSDVIPITLYKQTNKIITKQIDYYNDGSYKETDTGTEKFQNVLLLTSNQKESLTDKE